jgi:hypothetical protein
LTATEARAALAARIMALPTFDKRSVPGGLYVLRRSVLQEIAGFRPAEPAPDAEEVARQVALVEEVEAEIARLRKIEAAARRAADTLLDADMRALRAALAPSEP